jgi:hypothetical protein
MRLDSDSAPTKIIYEYMDGSTDETTFPPEWQNERLREWLEDVMRRANAK